VKELRDPLKRLRLQFDRAYRPLARIGKADSVGSIEYVRVFAEWREANCPTDIRQFIVRRANIGCEG
jgi:hypothetical protein